MDVLTGRDPDQTTEVAVIELDTLKDGSDSEPVNRKDFMASIDEVSDLYEAIKDGLYLLNGFTLPLEDRKKYVEALQKLQRLRDITCTQLRTVFEVE
jgi:hypothetical protein